MEIIPVEHGLDLLASDLVRSTGLHASQIYGDLFSDLEPTRYIKDGTPNTLKMAIGLAWEAWLERVFVRQGILAERPGELMSEEGIAYSPDLFVVNGIPRIGEIKATWMSSQTDLTDPKFDKWIVQVKLYCYWAEMTGARFYVLFMNGNYRGNRDPEFKVWDIDFSPIELQENYQMIINHAVSKGLL